MSDYTDGFDEAHVAATAVAEAALTDAIALVRSAYRTTCGGGELKPKALEALLTSLETVETEMATELEALEPTEPE